MSTSTDFIRDLWENERDTISPSRAAELARLVGAERPARPSGARAVAVAALRFGRKARAKVLPYLTLTSLGLGLLAGAALTLGVTAGLVGAGIAVLLAEWSAER